MNEIEYFHRKSLLNFHCRDKNLTPGISSIFLLNFFLTSTFMYFSFILSSHPLHSVSFSSPKRIERWELLQGVLRTMANLCQNFISFLWLVNFFYILFSSIFFLWLRIPNHRSKPSVRSVCEKILIVFLFHKKIQFIFIWKISFP